MDLLHSINVPIGGGYRAGWGGYSALRGGGLPSFLRWLVTFGAISRDESFVLEHADLERRQECHGFAGRRYCWCGHDCWMYGR